MRATKTNLYIDSLLLLLLLFAFVSNQNRFIRLSKEIIYEHSFGMAYSTETILFRS